MLPSWFAVFYSSLDDLVQQMPKNGSGRVSASWATWWILMCTQSIQLCLFKLICEVPKTKHLKSMVTLPTLKARKLFPRSKCWMLSHQMANIYFKQLSTDGLDTSCQISLCLPVATSILLIWASVYQYHHLIFSLLSGIVVIRWTNLTL